jgi:hypothetical protein
MCSSMMLSVRALERLPARIASLLGRQAVGLVRPEHEVRRARLLGGPVAGRERGDLLDLLHRQQGHDDQERHPRDEQEQDPAASAAARAAGPDDGGPVGRRRRYGRAAGGRAARTLVGSDGAGRWPLAGSSGGGIGITRVSSEPAGIGGASARRRQSSRRVSSGSP